MERRTEIVILTPEEIEAAVCSVLPGARVLGARLTDHGLANTNYFVDTSEGVFVLRLHARGPSLLAKETALHRRVAGLLPTAPLLGAIVDGPRGHCATLMQRVPGRPLGEFAEDATEGQLARLGEELGGVLAALTTVRFERAGDLVAAAPDAELSVEPWGFGDFYKWCLFETPAGERLGFLCERVWELVQRAESEYVDELGVHLVHGDFNPSNLMIDSSGQLSAVLDWEFAHVGKLWMDVGNLLRERPECPWPEGFSVGLARGLIEGGVALPENFRDFARLHDLSSACEWLSSTADRPEIHARAVKQVRQTLAMLVP